MPTTLGQLIHEKRGQLGLSAAEAARRAPMSTAYLLRLETDDQVQPSPLTLNKVANALKLPYEELLRLAGYLVPAGPRQRHLDPSTEALFADLDEEELRHLAGYIQWWRQQKKKVGPSVSARSPRRTSSGRQSR